MCGIAGLLHAEPVPGGDLEQVVRRMCDALVHRGPDDQGVWSRPEHRVALGQRRLAIVDLSPAGHQPMHSHCGRYTVVFNGEIYNHPELRDSLGAQSWRGHSDTETLLALFTRYGVTDSLPRLVGMFAFAVWDHHARTLTLARDRMGEKPLYWGRLPNGDFVFGSELRALRQHPAWAGGVDREALALFLRLACVPAPKSIHPGIHKLEPGTWVTVDLQGTQHTGRYWSLEEVARRGLVQPLRMSDEQAVSQLEALLTQAVRGQLLSDVPLGAFLSGGVDSSTVVALMAKLSDRPVRTFCIGFGEGATSEAAHARAVAAHLRTEHTELEVTGQDALNLVPRLPQLFDEPFGDSSQIPTHLVAHMARAHVTVALSGDAGDELFAGYNRHLIADHWWPRLAAWPLGLRRTASRAILGLSPAFLDRLGGWVQTRRAPAHRHADVGDKLHKLARDVLPARDVADLYARLTSHWLGEHPVPDTGSRPEDRWPVPVDCDPVSAMSLADQLGYLPDDILVKVDRAAMAASLETRAPLLDHRVVEFAWQVPLAQKLRAGTSKWLLRELLYRHVPRELIERPKQGFAVPLAAWLRGPLRDWAESLLSVERLKGDGWLDPAPVRKAWEAHLCGRANRQDDLWNVLMFQAWLQEWS
jgi:asparagine synthase (glutamine-hydrolysing)